MKLVIANTEGQLCTTSEVVASNTDTQHKNVLELVREYEGQLSELGPVAFETRKGKALPQGGFAKATEIAVLNEQQSTFLLTLMRNSEIVIKFKLALVKAFYEMREQIKPKVGSGGTAPEKMFPGYLRVAKLIGLDKNAAAIAANHAVFKKTGENVLALLGQEALEAEKQDLVFNVSDLVDGVSGQRMNKMLESAGLQTKVNERWVPTDDGKDFCRIFDTGKAHHDGTPVQQVKWSREVLDLLTLSEAA